MAGGAPPAGVEAELAQARTHVTDNERLVRALDLHAGSGPAEGRTGGEFQVRLHERKGLSLVGEFASVGGHERAGDLAGNLIRLLGDRKRAARAPEPYKHVGPLAAQTSGPTSSEISNSLS